MANLCAVMSEAADRYEAGDKDAAKVRCGHALRCADDACHAAGHEHETTSDGEGWCCGEECPCVPACAEEAE